MGADDSISGSSLGGKLWRIFDVFMTTVTGRSYDARASAGVALFF